MPPATHTARTTYLTVLRLPGAAAFFTAATTGRVGLAMTGLGLVWLVHGATGSYATAGVVSGAFAVADAVTAPQVARLVDRHGQTLVLALVLLAHAAAVAALVALVRTDAPTWLLAAGGAGVGASAPQLGALSAARWTALLRRGAPAPGAPAPASPGVPAAGLPTAFALESLANAASYLVGPVLVSAVAAGGHPALGSATAAALVLGGGSALVAQRRTAPAPAGPAPRERGAAVLKATGEGAAGDGAAGGGADRRLLRPAFGVLVGVSLATGVYFGALQVSVAAFAVDAGAPGAAAGLYAVSSGSGLLAAWAYGLRRWRTPAPVQLVAATGVLALTGLPLLVASTPVQLGAALAGAGLAVPVVLVLSSVLAEAGVHRAVLTQAFAWLASASAAGSAAAAAAAGSAVDAAGARAGFAIAAAAAAAMTVLARAGVSVLQAPQLPGPGADGAGR